MIKIERLKKNYNTIKALDDVSFEVGIGEVFGLLGPNGAGKTTLLNILCGLLSCDSGSITYGEDRKPLLGYVPQHLAIYEGLTARENLLFFGALYNLKGKALQEAVEEVLTFVGLEERADDYVYRFSGGMKRRLNIACALIHRPSILFFDEPTVGIDPQSRNMIFDKIRQLRQEGKTIFYTSHYMEEVELLCDRIAIMDQGRLIALDTLKCLLDNSQASTLEQLFLDMTGRSLRDP